MPGPSAVTPTYGFRYPVPDDTVDVPRDIGALAIDVENEIKKLLRAPITGADIAPNSITSAHILDGTINAADLGAGSVGAPQLQASIITGGNIVDQSIGINEMAPGHTLRMFGWFALAAFNCGANQQVSLWGPQDVAHQRDSGFFIFGLGGSPVGGTTPGAFRMWKDGGIAQTWAFTLSAPGFTWQVFNYNGVGGQTHNWRVTAELGNVPASLVNQMPSVIALLEQ